MTLEEIRKLVILESGRIDLEQEASEVGGTLLIDIYINAASRWLDLQQDTHKDEANYRGVLRPGEISPKVPLCRSINSVWALGENNSLIQLTNVTLEEAIATYPRLERTDRSFPRIWTARQLDVYNAEGGKGTEGLLAIFSDQPQYYGLSVLPPSSQELTLSVYGQFHSDTLTRPEDQNYWSANYPKILSLATQWSMEAANRNREGMADYESAIATYLLGIDRDDVDVLSIGPIYMNG